MTMINLLDGLLCYSKNSTGFPIENLPIGVCSLVGAPSDKNQAFACSRVGNTIIDLKGLADLGVLEGPQLKSLASQVFAKTTLNDFLELGRPAWTEFRSSLMRFLTDPQTHKAFSRKDIEACLHGFASEEALEEGIKMHLPISIGDYTDFYASKEHATNVGTMFRGKENALNPNWVHIPIGYHGRASTIVVSGTDIVRPCGQLKPKEGPPLFGASQKLDIELEMAFVVGKGNKLGQRIPMEKALDHIYGLVLMNDWSARDIQAWEYVPLGPFLGKSFGTSISPWLVSLEALEPFRVAGPKQDPAPLEYLQPVGPANYDIELQVSLQVRELPQQEFVVCNSNMRHMYWSIEQQLTHHAVNGCALRAGDLCGTGTLSGPSKDAWGSLLELSWNGAEPILLDVERNVSRTFLQDHDTVTLRATCKGPDYYLDFGKCIGSIAPALPY